MGDGSFDEAVRAALRLKDAEVLAARRRFDGYSPWYQFSLRPDAKVADCRASGSLAERFSLAQTLFSRAEARMSKRKLEEAQDLLFNALALFNWIVNENGEARQTLQDVNLRHKSFVGESDGEKADVCAFKAKALSTLADCFLRAKNWRHALMAADECIEIAELSSKAHRVRFLAIINDPRTGLGDHEEALRVLRGAAKRNPELKDFYSAQLKAVSEAMERDKRGYVTAFSTRSARVVGSSSSGAGGCVKLGFGEALGQCKEMRRLASALEAKGQPDNANKLLEKQKAINASLEQHINQVTNLGRLAMSNKREDCDTAEDNDEVRTKRVLEALFHELDAEKPDVKPQSEEQLLKLAINRVRYDEALEAAKKWVRHIKTHTMTSMLRSRSRYDRAQPAASEVEGGLRSRTREELVLLLSESMARDIVEMITADTALGSDQDLDLFSRLMERYDDPEAALELDGRLYANEWVRVTVVLVVALYLALMFYLSFAYPRDTNVKPSSPRH